MIYRRFGKRLLDVIVSFTVLLLSLPLLAAIGIAIRMTMGSPILFRQSRPGKNGKIFSILKFRTMSAECDAHGVLLADRRRITTVGKFLRATSLDELPELWNVLRGELSLVGPRPLLVEYLDYYSARERRRHEVRPGLTGLAQVSGRNRMRWEQRLQLDVQYVDRWCFLLDCKILLRTFATVLAGDGGIQALEDLGRFTGSTTRS